MKRKKELFILSSALLSIGLLAWVFSTLPIESVFTQFSSASPRLIYLYIISIIAMQTVLTWRWKYVLKSLDLENISFWKLNNYRLTGLAISFLTPTAKLGGEPVRAMLLSKKEDVAFDQSFSSVLIDKTIDFTMSGLFFLVGIAAFLNTYSLSDSIRFWLLTVGILLVLFIVLFYARMLRGKHFLEPILRHLKCHEWKPTRMLYYKAKDIEEIVIHFYHRDRKAYIIATLISGLSWIVMFIEYYIAGLLVGVNLSLFQIFLVFTFVGLAFIIPVPMAIGSLEAGQAGIFSLLGLGRAAGVGLSLVVRAKDILLTVIGLTVLTHTGFSLQSALIDEHLSEEDVEESDSQ